LRIGVVAVFCVLAFPYFKKSGPGQLIRTLLTGEAGARIAANDLADDVRNKWRLKGLQRWSTEVLARYRAGKLATNGPAQYPGNVRLASSEVPIWLQYAWVGDPPQVSIRLTESGDAECVTVAWYLSGLLVGPTNYVQTWDPWYIVQAKPGIYAYHGMK
jgi:hypothetical protein